MLIQEWKFKGDAMMRDRKARRLHKQRNRGRKNAQEEARRVVKINKRKSLRKKAQSSSSKSAFINLTEREKGMRNEREREERSKQVKIRGRKRGRH